MKLLYSAPATDENHATVLGNGHLGLWAYRKRDDLIHLNESTFWSGRPTEYEEKNLKNGFLKARELMLQNKPFRAEKTLLKSKDNLECEDYLPVCDLRLSASSVTENGVLDTENGVLYANGTEYFVSYTERIFVLHRAEDFSVTITSPYGDVVDGTRLYGKARNGGMGYCVQLKKTTDESGCTWRGTVVTGYIGWEKEPIREEKPLLLRAEAILEKASAYDYPTLFQRHTQDFSAQFDKCRLFFGEENDSYRADDLLAVSRTGVTPALMNAYFSYAKYLTVSSSRVDSEATNLQGIWNKEIFPPWHCDYTVNINTEMNYWLPDAINMRENFLPLLSFMKKVSEKGKKTAEKLGCKGFCSFHNVDLWGFTEPVGGDLCYAFNPFCGAWLTVMLYDHYRYTLDNKYLEEIYPVLKGACLFALSYLCESNGELVTAPATSPEHKYRKGLFLLAAAKVSSFDMFVLSELFDDFCRTAELLNRDLSLRDEAETVRKKLFRPRIGKDGRLCEYDRPYPDMQKGHRHFSHLIGLFPLHQITDATPEYKEAVRKSLVYRLKKGSGYTGWSCAWALNLLIALREKDYFEQYLLRLFRDSTYPNFNDSHPPFQIDGNFGAARAFCGLVATVSDGVITLLPLSLPQVKNGSAENLCLEGGYRIGMVWQNFVPKKLSVYSEAANAVSFRFGDDGTVKTFALTVKKENILIS